MQKQELEQTDVSIPDKHKNIERLQWNNGKIVVEGEGLISCVLYDCTYAQFRTLRKNAHNDECSKLLTAIFSMFQSNGTSHTEAPDFVKHVNNDTESSTENVRLKNGDDRCSLEPATSGVECSTCDYSSRVYFYYCERCKMQTKHVYYADSTAHRVCLRCDIIFGKRQSGNTQQYTVLHSVNSS